MILLLPSHNPVKTFLLMLCSRVRSPSFLFHEGRPPFAGHSLLFSLHERYGVFTKAHGHASLSPFLVVRNCQRASPYSRFLFSKTRRDHAPLYQILLRSFLPFPAAMTMEFPFVVSPTSFPFLRKALTVPPAPPSLFPSRGFR